jgi:beta-glucosidase
VGEAPRHAALAVTPAPFLWGAATSAYQVEGALANDWTEWESRGKLKAAGVRCGRGAGHRERWRSDLALLPTIGANAYRFSIEWSRLEPEPGRFDPAALEHDRRIVDFLADLGIEPLVTLHHYTHPPWFWEKGGWEEPQSIAWFARLARFVADALGSRVRLWVTSNEPITFLLGGYIAGVIPPGKKSFAAAGRALEHLLGAHVEAAEAIREVVPDARFGFAHNMLAFALDRRLVAAAERLYNVALLEAVATGRMDWNIPSEGRVVFDVAALPPANDFIGVNYYSRAHLRFRPSSNPKVEYAFRDPGGRGLTDTGWEVYPQGLERVIRTAASSGLPILMTENGIATENDRRRCDFLREHTLVLAHLWEAGLPIEGYFYWSLLDNFEWLEGFRPRFGLFGVDYATFARRRRPSADLFASLGKAFAARRGRRKAGRA